MAYQYRDYQQDIHDRTFGAWRSINNVLVVSDVGTGKTVLISNITRQYLKDNPTKQVVVIAHRRELVSQISLSLAENGLNHQVIAGKSTQRFITKRHIKKFQRSYIKHRDNIIAASVGTLVNNKTIDKARVGLWIIDEAHHTLSDNQWGKCVAQYPNAKGLGVTATPLRADGKGLGRTSDGVFDVIVQNKKGMAQLIVEGSLSRFEIYAPPSNLDLREVNITATGDYSKLKLSHATRRSSIIGDVVKHYKQLAMGKLGVTFVPDVGTGEFIAQSFNQQGVPAALITANTPDSDRAELLDKLERREILQLVNVDIFGEGFNLPAIEVVSFARATASYGLYVQQFGRALRTLDGKTHAIIIDHVGNVERHGLPTGHKVWTLDRREKRSRSESDADKMTLKTCIECTRVYEAYHYACPYCGHEPNVNITGTIDELGIYDGDLVLMDISHIDELHREIARIDRDLGPRDLPTSQGAIVVNSVKKKHKERQEAQKQLRESMARWSGHYIKHYDLRERQRLFYIKFDIDVLTAQTLGKRAALELKRRIDEYRHLV